VYPAIRKEEKGQIFIVDMKEKGKYATIRNVISEDWTP